MRSQNDEVKHQLLYEIKLWQNNYCEKTQSYEINVKMYHNWDSSY